MAVFLIADNTKDQIEISNGETDIGRGPYLKVADKRVSRAHATLKLKDHILSVKPIHKNPTFCRSIGQTQFVPLSKDVWKELSHGDTISLLPNDLIFSVEITQDKTQPYNIAGNVEDNRLSNEDDCTPVEDNDEIIFNKIRSDLEQQKLPLNESLTSPLKTTTETKNIKPTTSPDKKRKLPSWMLATEQASPSKNKIAPVKKVQKKKNSNNDKKEVRKTLEEEDMPSEQKKEPVVKSEKDSNPVKEDNDGEKDISKKQCPYGQKCYRKNPAHLEEFSHMDAPLNNASDIVETDKPECEYGTSCYRSNAEHLQEYKHTKSPGTNKRSPRLSRTKKQAKGKSVLDNASDDDGEGNSYDYDDSFLNDDEGMASSESYDNDDEDSDFCPEQQVEDEDLNELVNEANEFVKNKKL